jgi:hypothetical protein
VEVGTPQKEEMQDAEPDKALKKNSSRGSHKSKESFCHRSKHFVGHRSSYAKVLGTIGDLVVVMFRLACLDHSLTEDELVASETSILRLLLREDESSSDGMTFTSCELLHEAVFVLQNPLSKIWLGVTSVWMDTR